MCMLHIFSISDSFCSFLLSCFKVLDKTYHKCFVSKPRYKSALKLCKTCFSLNQSLVKINSDLELTK